jgi:hypothetical protein
MHEPAAIWSMQLIVFDKEISLTQNVILSHGREALKATIRAIRNLSEMSASGPLVNSSTNPRLHSLISDLCYQAGLAATILFNDAKKGFKESASAYQIRKQRVEYVRKLCEEQKVEIITLKDREVRNALTHIDERLADILTEQQRIGWFIDTTIDPNSDWNTKENLQVNYCRCYDMKNHRILHLGQELDLRALYQECAAILAVVFGVDEKKV